MSLYLISRECARSDVFIPLSACQNLTGEAIGPAGPAEVAPSKGDSDTSR